MTIGSLSRDVFERPTSTGSELFSLLVCLDANKFVLLSLFSPLKTIYSRVSTKLLPNDVKSSLPVDVRRSKTLLLKLPNGSEHRPRISVPCSRQRFCWPFIGFCHKINFDWSAVGDSFFAGIGFLTTSPFFKAPQQSHSTQ